MSLSPELEFKLIEENKYDYILGIDEAGRGCLAGPVYVSGYIFTPSNKTVDGVNDSKMVPLKIRENIFKEIINHSNLVTSASNESIDSKGIAVAIEDLISEIISNTFKEFGQNGLVLIDGRFKRKFGDKTRQIIKGDATYYSIAAASILSKVSRDKQMVEVSKEFPEYKFHRHKGYATKFHRNMIEKIGPCSLHRKSFSPVSKSII